MLIEKHVKHDILKLGSYNNFAQHEKFNFFSKSLYPNVKQLALATE